MSEKNSLSKQLNETLEKNKSLKILIPLILVLVIVVAVLYLPGLFSGGDASVSTGPDTTLPPGAENGETVDVLPQTERGESADIVIENDPFKAEMQGVMSLTGISKNSEGKYRAIVVSGETAFIVSDGEYLGETEWKVDNITDDSIEFSSEDGVKILTLEETEELE